MRDLASICTVDKVWELEGKDRVQGASFKENAYEVMVSKDIQPGMLVAFIQEGAVLPEITQWEWLRKRCYRDDLKGFLIKPQKFASIKSWGLAVPLNELPLENTDKLKAGDDITELLNICKYESEEDASPKQNNKISYPKWVKFCLSHSITRWIGRLWKKRQKEPNEFPSHLISKSDETTIQNYPSLLEKFADSKVVITAKMEGQSFTVIPVIKNGKFITAYPCSRNKAYKKKDNSIFWKMMDKYDVIEKMKAEYKETKKAYIIQGEQVGPEIQNNIYKFKDNEWYVYTVKDFKTLTQLDFYKAKSVALEFDFSFVPELMIGTLKDIMQSVDEAVEIAERAIWTRENPCGCQNFITTMTGKLDKKLWKEYFQHEGIVVRTIDYDKDNHIGCSFKVKNLEYAERGLAQIAKDCKDLLSK